MDKEKAYREKMEAELREIEGKIEVLKAKASKAKAEQKIQVQDKLDSLESKKATFQKKLKDMKESGSSAFEDVKGGVQSAYDDLKHSLDSALDRFKE